MALAGLPAGTHMPVIDAAIDSAMDNVMDEVSAAISGSMDPHTPTTGDIHHVMPTTAYNMHTSPAMDGKPMDAEMMAKPGNFEYDFDDRWNRKYTYCFKIRKPFGGKGRV